MAVDMDDSEQSDDGEEGNDDYETITVSEAAPDEHRYDQQIDMQEERQAIMKIKGDS